VLAWRQDLRRYPSGKTWLVSDLEKVPKGLHEGFLISGIFGDVARGALTRTALKLFNKRYKPNDWGVVGPKLVCCRCARAAQHVSPV
jgi:hypothetical protein